MDGPYQIGEIKFRDIIVKVYHDINTDIDTANVAWQARNPDSFYEGIMFIDVNNKISYPDDAIIPVQTEKNREILPKFIITGLTEITNKFSKKTFEFLKKQYKYRNM